MILTVLFAADARTAPLSDTCRRLRGIPDEHAIATALYSCLPDFDTLKRHVQVTMAGHLPKALRRRPLIVALDMTLIPYYGADARTNPHVYRSQPKQGTSSFYAYASAYLVCHGQRYTVALKPVFRSQALKETVRELLAQVRKAGVQVRLLVVDRELYTVETIHYFQAARYPFVMPVVAHGRSASHPMGPSGSQVFKQGKRSGWTHDTLSNAQKRKATLMIYVKCRNRRGERSKKGR